MNNNNNEGNYQPIVTLFAPKEVRDMLLGDKPITKRYCTLPQKLFDKLKMAIIDVVDKRLKILNTFALFIENELYLVNLTTNKKEKTITLKVNVFSDGCLSTLFPEQSNVLAEYVTDFLKNTKQI